MAEEALRDKPRWEETFTGAALNSVVVTMIEKPMLIHFFIPSPLIPPAPVGRDKTKILSPDQKTEPAAHQICTGRLDRHRQNPNKTHRHKNSPYPI